MDNILKLYALVAAGRAYFNPTGREEETKVLELAGDFGFYLGQPIRQFVELLISIA